MVDTSKAKRLLGFEPKISLKEGLRDTVEWYRQQKVEVGLR
jgi:nucleoside-diphosphate-sugar epimerase